MNKFLNICIYRTSPSNNLQKVHREIQNKRCRACLETLSKNFDYPFPQISLFKTTWRPTLKIKCEKLCIVETLCYFYKETACMRSNITTLCNRIILWRTAKEGMHEAFHFKNGDKITNSDEVTNAKKWFHQIHSSPTNVKCAYSP